MKFREETFLIGNDGRPTFGIHSTPLKKLNIEDFRPHGKPDITMLERGLISGLRVKRWIYLGVCNEEMIFGMAVVHIGYLSNLFAYIFDRASKNLKEYNLNQLLASQTVFKGNSADGSVSFTDKDTLVGIDFNNNSISVDAKIKNEMNARLKFITMDEQLSAVTRVGLKGFNYTNKVAGLPVSGIIRFSDKDYRVDEKIPSGVADYTLGYLGRKTFWNWASGSGLDRKGRKIGFNFSQGVNETGFTENAFWIDGKMVKTDNVDFRYDDLHLLSPWEIVSNDGKVNITFHPEGERSLSQNFLFVSSRYKQPFGRFTGTLCEGRGVYNLKSVSGFVEEHEAKW